MDRNEENFKTWNKIAGLYQEKFMDLTLYDESCDAFTERLESGSKVLDIGCGPGNISAYLIKRRPDLEIDGVDMAPNMIDLAKRNVPSGHFQVMDCRKIDSIEKTFDGAICGFTLPYLSENEVRKLAKDVGSLLNNDGIFYLSFVVGNPESSGFITNSMGDHAYFFYHTEAFVTQTLTDAGFTVFRMFQVDYPKGDGVEVHTVCLSKKINAPFP